MLCYAMLCYAMLCYAILYYAILCYTIRNDTICRSISYDQVCERIKEMFVMFDADGAAHYDYGYYYDFYDYYDHDNDCYYMITP